MILFRTTGVTWVYYSFTLLVKSNYKEPKKKKKKKKDET